MKNINAGLKIFFFFHNLGEKRSTEEILSMMSEARPSYLKITIFIKTNKKNDYLGMSKAKKVRMTDISTMVQV